MKILKLVIVAQSSKISPVEIPFSFQIEKENVIVCVQNIIEQVEVAAYVLFCVLSQMHDGMHLLEPLEVEVKSDYGTVTKQSIGLSLCTEPEYDSVQLAKMISDEVRKKLLPSILDLFQSEDGTL